jgi:hypothetical protein
MKEDVAKQKVQKIDEKSMELIREFKQNYSGIIGVIGELEIEKDFLQLQLSQIKEKQAEFKEKYKLQRDQEAELAKELKEKYGEGQINLETGEFVST